MGVVHLPYNRCWEYTVANNTDTAFRSIQTNKEHTGKIATAHACADVFKLGPRDIKKLS